MKKVIVFFNSIFIILCTAAFSLVFLSEIPFADAEDLFKKFYLYSKVTIVTSQTINFDQTVKSGGLNYATFLKNDQNKAVGVLNDYKFEGLVFYFAKDIPLDYFNNAVSFNLTPPILIEGIKVYYGYDEDYQDFVVREGKRVNVQLAQTENGWILGMPLILTGF